MSEFRAALQALHQSLNGCEIKPFVDGALKKYNDACSTAVALLARPEPKTYLFLEGYELANAYECLGGDLETDVTISSFAEAKDQETGEEMPAGMYLSFTDYPEEGRIFLSPTEAPAVAEPVARPEPVTDNSKLASKVRASVEWLANNAKGMSLLNWDTHSNVLLRAADALDEVARPEPEPTGCWVHPAPDAAAPMSSGKMFTAAATYRIIEAGTSHESVPGIAYPRMKPRTVPVDDDEPEPRITREEAIELLHEYYRKTATRAVAGEHVSTLSAAAIAGLNRDLDTAREACLAAMLRSEPDDICCLGFKDANECRCHREEQASAEKAREYRETGWLVENGMPSDIKYRFMDDDGPQWTSDPLKAIRFARRADAEMFAAGDDDAWRIVEHMFVSPPAASDGE